MKQYQDPPRTSSARVGAALLIAGAVMLGETGCVMEPSTYVVEDDYPTARYDDHVVYYTDAGRPFYYLGGAVVYVPRSYPGYEALVINYRRHPTDYRYHGYSGDRDHDNRPPPDRFEQPRRPPSSGYTSDIRRDNPPPSRQYGNSRPPPPPTEQFQPPQRTWTDSSQPAPRTEMTRRGPPPDSDAPSYSAPASRDQWQPTQRDQRDGGGRGDSSFGRTDRSESPAPRQSRMDAPSGRDPGYVSSRGADRQDRRDQPSRRTERGSAPSDGDDQGVRPPDGQRFRDQ